MREARSAAAIDFQLNVATANTFLVAETILLVILAMVALGCYCFNIVMWFGVAVNQNVLAPVFLMISFILFSAWVVANR